MNDYLVYFYSINRMSELHRQAERERLIREFSRPAKTNVFSWVLGIILVCFGIALFIY